MNPSLFELEKRLINDCIMSHNATDLFNALARLEKGSIAILNLTRAQQLDRYVDEEAIE